MSSLRRDGESRELKRRAMIRLRSAERLRGQAQWEASFDEYMIGLELYLEAIRKETDMTLKEQMQVDVTVYMDHADEVKKRHDALTDTSRDEELARRLQASEERAPPSSTDADERLARRLQRRENRGQKSVIGRAQGPHHGRSKPKVKPRTIAEASQRSANRQNLRSKNYLKRGTGRARLEEIKRRNHAGQKCTEGNSGHGRMSERRGGRNSKRGDEASQFKNIVESEIIDGSPGVLWDDVAGLQLAKQTLQEAVILPMLRPDIFSGIRSPPRGVLLYGPPGTGKTMLAKAVASESNATFFNISAASLTSKWVGESSKLVRALFSVARERSPAVVFIDEIDSVLSARSTGEHNASRQLKTEFLVQFDGVGSSSDAKDRILIIGATNRPWELDEAVRRRMEKRIFIPMPGSEARGVLLRTLMRDQDCQIASDELKDIVRRTKGYSGSDLAALCREAALGPIRELGPRVANVRRDEIRSIMVEDFIAALKRVRASVVTEAKYEEWTREFGTRGCV